MNKGSTLIVIGTILIVLGLLVLIFPPLTSLLTNLDLYYFHLEISFALTIGGAMCLLFSRFLL